MLTLIFLGLAVGAAAILPIASDMDGDTSEGHDSTGPETDSFRTEIPSEPDTDEDKKGHSDIDLLGSSGGSNFEEHIIDVGDGEFHGGAGDDQFTVSSDAYSDTANSWDRIEIYAGAGNDIITGAPASIDDSQKIHLIAYGGEGEDAFYGGENNETFIDTSGASVVFGGGGHDDFTLENGSTAHSGGGNDRLHLGENSSAFGGEGNDILLLGDGSSGVGGEGNDELILGNFASANGGSGDDTLNLGGNSSAFGGDGNDSISLSGGSTAYGGQGNDDYDFALSLDQDAPALIADFVAEEDEIGSITVIVSSEQYTEFDVEFYLSENGLGTDVLANGKTLLHVVGAKPSDFDETQIRVRLTDGGTISDGDNGSFITGQTSDFPNTIIGNRGDDYLYGDGEDVLFGGEGDDRLFLEGSTVASGGEGEDIFSIGFADNLVVIKDFNQVEDVIYVDIENERLDDGTYTLDYLEIKTKAWPDGSGADLLIDGVVFARISGGQNLLASDIKIK